MSKIHKTLMTNMLSKNKSNFLNRDTSSLNSEIKQALKNWKEIIAQYKIPNYKKASIQICNSFLPYIGLWVLTYFALQYSIWLAIPLFIINAGFLVRIFIIQHDCGHQSFFKSKKLNNLVGTICSIFSFIPFKYWAKVHNHHHGHSGVLEHKHRDVGDIPTLTVDEYKKRTRWGKLRYYIWRMPIVTFGIAPVYYFIVVSHYPTSSFGNWSKYAKIITKDALYRWPIYIVLCMLIGVKNFILVQGITVWLFGIVAFWFFYVQHQHEMTYKHWKDDWDFLLSSIRGASYYKLPRILHWLSGNIGYHHIHHLSSLIPNYNLPKAFKEKPILNKYVTQITFRESLKLPRYKLWDEKLEKMISFKEYRKNNKYKAAA